MNFFKKTKKKEVLYLLFWLCSALNSSFPHSFMNRAPIDRKLDTQRNKNQNICIKEERNNPNLANIKAGRFVDENCQNRKN